ncbi:FAD-binding protein [Oxyplasma meridianum]|uniref:FAD-binding protein n=1 Tax=Oxyplasma meridianum TaxID=3073602 RepID=A0AAX4NIB3_9ARCH
MDFLEELKKISGNNVFTSKEDMIPYLNDASYFEGVLPLAVVVPVDTQEVSRIMKLCYDNNMPVTVRGGGSSLTGSSILSEKGIVLSLAGFDRIEEISTGDNLAVVQPGVRLDALNQALARSGYFYPPDPASSMAATVGGSISTNAGGLRASLYGTTKNWILGLDVVLADGNIVKFGGRTLKRSSGYDLTALMVGSEGTLGVITRAYLKIWPLPEEKGRVSAYFSEIEKVGQSISEIKKIGIMPMIAEFLDRITMDSLESTTSLKFPKDAKYLLIMDVTSTAQSIDIMLESVYRKISELNPISISKTRDPKVMDEMYAARKGAYSSLLKQRETSTQKVVIGDVVVPASKLPEALKSIEKKGYDHGLKVALFGHIGDGNIHCNIYADVAKQEIMKEVDAFQMEIGEIAVNLGGSVSAEHGIGIEKKELLSREFRMRNSEYTIEMMKQIKKIIDPKGILNRGKILE